MDNADDIKNATSEDFASDAMAMVRAARLHSDIDPRLIGVFGRSVHKAVKPKQH